MQIFLMAEKCMYIIVFFVEFEYLLINYVFSLIIENKYPSIDDYWSAIFRLY